MDRPNNAQIEAASAVIRQYATQYGATAADNRTRTAVFSMAACLGFPGVPAEEYATTIAERTGDARPKAPVRITEDGFEIEDANVLGIKAGHYMLVPLDDEDAVGPALTEEQLGNLNKTKLIAAINRETGFAFDKYAGTKAQLISALLGWRDTGGRDGGQWDVIADD